MSEQKRQALNIHPYIGGSAANLIKSVINNRGVSKRNIPTLALTLFGTLLTWPLRLIENRIYRKEIASLKPAEDPIFIIGHWRSGTTHLHNVVSQDPRYGYLSTLQALFPTCVVVLSRSPRLKRAIAKLLPPKRMMDNMELGLDLPQEEEFSLSCVSTASHHCNHFPNTVLESFEKFVLFNTDQPNKERWKDAYQKVILKAAYLAKGKRLVLKNPYNTARIKVLLEMYPNAKFIHIHRNPYNIYVSALHDFIKEAEEMALQDFSEERFAEVCYIMYERLMKRFWETRDLVPTGNFAEVAYETFETDPIGELERIYKELNLDFDEAARASVTGYLSSIKSYKKNKYTYSQSQADSIKSRWGFAIEKMGYSLPGDILLSDSRAWTCKMDY